jgi:DNA-binding TFAR19-related protein (PDSD5 family)
MTSPTDQTQQVLERALADKAAERLRLRALAWPEKVRTIERLRDATRLARQGMKATRRG